MESKKRNLDLTDLLMAGDMAENSLTPEERAILDRYDTVVEEQEVGLRRKLNDSERDKIRNDIPGANEAVIRNGQLISIAQAQIRSKSGGIQ